MWYRFCVHVDYVVSVVVFIDSSVRQINVCSIWRPRFPMEDKKVYRIILYRIANFGTLVMSAVISSDDDWHSAKTWNKSLKSCLDIDIIVIIIYVLTKMCGIYSMFFVSFLIGNNGMFFGQVHPSDIQQDLPLPLVGLCHRNNSCTLFSSSDSSVVSL